MQMAMGMNMQQQMKASPALVALNSMLVLTTLELQQLVSQELEDNPALEQLEAVELTCDMCGRPLQDGICLLCLQSDRDIQAAASSLAEPADYETDPLLSVPAPLSALEILEGELRVTIPVADYPIADYLIGSLDSRGFLESSVADLAAQLGVAEERVVKVLRVLQELGPPGIGARTMQECLLLQIDLLEPRDWLHSLLRRVIADHWEDFAAHRYTELARALGVSYDALVQVRDLLRSRLQPYPLAQGDEALLLTRSSTPLPDVVISAEGDGFVVDIAESRRFSLRLNPLYQELSRAVGRGDQAVSVEESEHLRSHVARARLFLKNIRHRRDTIRRITEYVVERQDAFLRNGIRQLAPLTRTEVGEAIGLNESTVSRATAHKYVLLPSREIIPFAHFFSASLSVKDVIKELIGTERVPLTDEEIVARLQTSGIAVARRTVAKYRKQLGIPPSTLR